MSEEFSQDLPTLDRLISLVEANVPDPKVGLPDDVFYFVGRMTPYINVDILIELSDGRRLFTWRNDKYTGAGWHIPGGIIRYKENAERRIQEVARIECGITIDSFEGPIKVSEIIASELVERAHFISLLYRCSINTDAEAKLQSLTENKPASFLLAEGIPDDLLSWHNIYRDVLSQ